MERKFEGSSKEKVGVRRGGGTSGAGVFIVHMSNLDAFFFFNNDFILFSIQLNEGIYFLIIQLFKIMMKHFPFLFYCLNK